MELHNLNVSKFFDYQIISTKLTNGSISGHHLKYTTFKIVNIQTSLVILTYRFYYFYLEHQRKV